MFAYKLNSSQQSALLYLAHKIIHADGDFADKELDKLDLLNKEVNFNIQPVETSDQQLTQLFADRVSQKILLLELLLISQSDGNQDKTECKLIKHYSNLLKFDNAQEFTQLNQLAKQLSQLREQAEKFIDH